MKNLLIALTLMIALTGVLSAQDCPNRIVGNHNGMIITSSLFSTMVEKQTEEMSVLRGYSSKNQQVAEESSKSILGVYGVVLTPEECATNSVIHSAYRRAEKLGDDSSASRAFIQKMKTTKSVILKVKIAKDFLAK